MANKLDFNGHPFSVFGELDNKESFYPDEYEGPYKNLRYRGEDKGKGKFTQSFIPIEDLISEIPSPEEILLEKESQGLEET